MDFKHFPGESFPDKWARLKGQAISIAFQLVGRGVVPECNSFSPYTEQSPQAKGVKMRDNRGGVRPGAGRPVSEKTKQMRIPEGAVQAVKDLLEKYKAGSLVSQSPIVLPIVAPEIKQDEKPQSLRLHPDFKSEKVQAYAHLNGLTKRERRVFIKRYGSMSLAAESLAVEYLRRK